MAAGAQTRARYYPDVFDVADIARAKKIILTEEGPGADTETRWAVETPYVMELIGGAFALRPEMLVLDYGSGIGRIAKAMIAASGCSVIGVDISPSMRALALDYVGSERFVALSPAQFDRLVAAGLRVHAAIAVWVLQHCFAPTDDISRIAGSLDADGRAFVLNMPKRAVPAVIEGEPAEKGFVWARDGIDVAALLRASFAVAAEGEPDRSRTPNMADAGAYWMSLRHRRG
jgi:SAM-dependent methyltransferase